MLSSDHVGWRAPSRPLGRKHDASSVGSLVDLRPVPRFKRMNGGVLSLRSQVFCNGNVEIGIGLPPDEQDGQVRTPEIRKTGGVSRDFVKELIGHLRESRRCARPLREVLVHDRPKKFVVTRLLRFGHARLHLATLKIEQPGELLWACEEMAGESLKILVGEKLDKFRDP